MPNPLLSVRQKIQAVIPEIMELKFGCQFIWRDESYTKYAAVFENWIVKDKTIRCMSRPFFRQYSIEKNHIVEILGRPILAQDVLHILPHDWMLKGSNGRHEFKDQDPMFYEFLDEILK